MAKVWCDQAVRSRVFFGVIQSVTGSLGAIATLLLLTPAVYAEAVSEAVDTGQPVTEAIAPLELTDLDQPATPAELNAVDTGEQVEAIAPLELNDLEQPATTVEAQG